MNADGHGLIQQSYGETLDEIRQNISRIIEEDFIDEDGFILDCLSTRTLKPFADDDPEVHEFAIHEGFWANASLPYELKRTAINYEDSDMAAGDYLMALLASVQGKR